MPRRIWYLTANIYPCGGCSSRSGCRGWSQGRSISSPAPARKRSTLGAWGKVGVQICYEIIFSGDVVDPDARPDYIFNPSNDGWFGKFGPPQHLAQARMRALEEGLPVLRATTTGISAVIDADGIVREHIGMNRAERIHSVVPPAKSPTPFALLGHWLTLVWTALLIAVSACCQTHCEALGRRST